MDTIARDRSRSIFATYFVPALAVAVMVVCRGPLLGAVLAEDAPLLLSVLAVVVSAMFGGLRAGLVATVFAAVAGTYFFIEPYHDFRIDKVSDRVRIVLFLGEGALVSWLCDRVQVARRRTEAKQEQLEEEVERRRTAEAELAVRDEKKDEFLATLSHELRNPLFAIGNALHILKTAAGGSKPAEQMRELAERQVNQMKRLIEDLMDLSRIGNGKMLFCAERVDLATVLRTAVETCRPRIEASGHELTVGLPSEPLFLVADQARLVQVFSNLLTNAAKYTDPGGQIHVRAESLGDDIAVSVRDNGIGLPAEAVPTLFDMFAQVEGGRKQRQGGLGIGLALVDRLVQAHGGRVEVRSEGIGRGSEFTVRLPAAVEARDRTTDTPTKDKMRESAPFRGNSIHRAVGERTLAAP